MINCTVLPAKVSDDCADAGVDSGANIPAAPAIDAASSRADLSVLISIRNPVVTSDRH